MRTLFNALVLAMLLPTGVFSQQFNGNKNGEMVPSRMVQGAEVDPFYQNPPGNEYFSLPELGVELIWDNNLKMLYVLKRIYFEGRELCLNGNSKLKEMPLTVISEVFVAGDDGFREVCLGKFADSGEEFWLGVLTQPSSLQVEIYSNFPDTKPVYYKKWIVK
ncbi:MAG: hypothetical protein J6L86_01510 [Alphaproteobacteria bacterium]|nr:hypothetical protein [Alphaproteobacteria bacterium]MBQ8630463.1 hypothetical protein [Alphaproteobacteria bacterium]